MSVHTLYRFFDAQAQLLYVGLSVNPGRRMEKHRGEKAWWNEVARIDMEQHADLTALRLAERNAIATEKPLYNVRMNGKTAQTSTYSDAPLTISGLVGRHFHSWRERKDDDSEFVTVRRGLVLEWQGHVVEQIDDDIYLVELYSWWDGCSDGSQRMVRLDDMRLWTFYDSALEMQIGLGCRESEGPDYRDCGNPITHVHDMRSYGFGLHLVCSSCVHRYPGFRDYPELKWRNGKPVLP